jgi:hypothetical protein
MNENILGWVKCCDVLWYTGASKENRLRAVKSPQTLEWVLKHLEHDTDAEISEIAKQRLQEKEYKA